MPEGSENFISGAGSLARWRGSHSPRQARVGATIEKQGVLGIVRSASSQEAHRTVMLLWQAGLRTVEISVSTPGAVDAVAQLVAGRPDPALIVGAGTIIDVGTARSAVSAGADLLVSPLADPDVIAVGRDADVAVLAGAATPAEAVAALKAGASLVKLFPATMFSPVVVADILQALPGLPLVPTGGVAITDIGAWIGAGAIAVGLGGALGARSSSEVRARVESALAAVSEAKAGMHVANRT
jgi:2-dehydro-3-deoxyphosphogluconate aldolase/(4S)-4-hydroxy-2-oxoglutarate aldolase